MAGEFLDQLGGHVRHVDRADERPVGARIGGRAQSASGRQQWPDAAHLVTQDVAAGSSGSG